MESALENGLNEEQTKLLEEYARVVFDNRYKGLEELGLKEIDVLRFYFGETRKLKVHEYANLKPSDLYLALARELCNFKQSKA